MDSCDYLRELFAFGVNGVIFALCLNDYLGHKRTIAALETADQFKIDKDLVKHVGAQRDKKIQYAVVRGTVTPIGPPLKSVMSPVTGVLQVIKIYEHRVARGFVGMWVEHQKQIHETSNDVPFALSNGEGVNIEIIDALSSEILDMDIVYDNYEPISNSFMDNIYGFFLGVRKQGLQTTEEILRDGSFITAVGELELDGNQLRMQASKSGPMILTTATKNTILRRLRESKSSTLFKVVVFGTIGVILASIIGRKIYMKRKRGQEERAIKDKLEKNRRIRREQARETDTSRQNISDDQKCVICITNPKEIICLPCGHVCMCEECAVQITDKCPVCRTHIETKAAAFIS